MKCNNKNNLDDDLDIIMLTEAKRRLKGAKPEDFISSEDVLLNLGITEEELNDVDIELD